MTFEQFQATRRWADDLTKVEGMDLGSDEPTPGFYYHGCLHIFAREGGFDELYDLADGNQVEIKADFELVIGNVIETNEDLTPLERQLYAWGKDEGFFD